MVYTWNRGKETKDVHKTTIIEIIDTRITRCSFPFTLFQLSFMIILLLVFHHRHVVLCLWSTSILSPPPQIHKALFGLWLCFYFFKSNPKTTTNDFTSSRVHVLELRSGFVWGYWPKSKQFDKLSHLRNKCTWKFLFVPYLLMIHHLF